MSDKFPPRVWLIKYKDQGATIAWFRKPEPGEPDALNCVIDEFLSLPEHEAILREARAKVWEEASKLDQPYTINSYRTSLRAQAAKERGGE